MNNFMKKAAAMIMAVATIMTIAVAPQTQIDVFAMSRKSAQSQVKQLNKRIKKLKNKVKSARAQDEKDNTEIKTLNGFIQCLDPLVVSDAGTGMLLYFESATGLTKNGNYGMIGYYKLSNQYVRWNGNQVQVAIAVERPHAEADAQARLDAAINERDELNRSLNDAVIIDDITVQKGSTVPLTIRWKYGTPSYNTFKYKAKKSGIATVSSNGTVTGKKKGKTTFTATMSASGKKVTFSVRVV